MSAKWKPEKYKDDYKVAVEKWVKAKLEKLPESRMAPRVKTAKAPKAANFIDLLKKSLEHSKKGTKNDAGMKQKHLRSRSTARPSAVRH